MAGARVTSRTIDRDRGYKRIRDTYRKAGRRAFPHVLVGLRGDGPAGSTHSEGGGPLTLAEIGSIHEFGLGNPERSFIRATFDSRLRELALLAERLSGRMVDGAVTLRGALELLGEVHLGHIRAEINAGISPPNAPETIARKGSTTPLVNFGQLKGALDFKVKGA